jgi:peroxiredoxin
MEKENHKQSILGPGTPAPSFKLRSTPDQFLALSDYRGSNLILAFYPADWSPVCGDQMNLYNELLPELHSLKPRGVGRCTGET